MKRLVVCLLVAFMSVASALACEITLKTVGDKQSFKAGDEVLIDVKVKLIHHHCELAIKDTKFTYDGLKIISATPWKEESPGVYTRQVKAQVIASDKSEARLSVQRNCDRDGGRGSITIKKTA
jgi:hypothetical protein